MTNRIWPDKCSTCHKEYKKRAENQFCSNSFHCCRDCVWYAGKRIVLCKECEEEDKRNAKT